MLISPTILSITEKIRFWRAGDLLLKVSYPIAIIRKNETETRTKWPGDNPPDWQDIETDLSASRSGYVDYKYYENRGTEYLRIMVGRYILGVSSWRKYGKLKLFLKNIEFGNNKERSKMLKQGVHFEFKGIFFVEKEEGRNYESEWEHFLSKCRERPRAAKYFNDDMDETDDASILTESEANLLKSLEIFIDSEYALEQQKAREELGFTYIDFVPEPRKSIVRQYYRATLLDADYKRLKDLKPSIVSMRVREKEILVQIENIDANTHKGEIIVSILKQMQVGQLPKDGEFKLVAIDTLQKVRKEVVEGFRNGTTQNSWAIKLAVGKHEHSALIPVSVQMPASKFPYSKTQAAAIEAGAGTDDYLLVLGPPGTGKTTVISSWVEHFVKQGKRILISSQNNKAVDNVLEKVSKNEKLTCVRLGNESKVSSIIHDLLIDNCATNLQRKLVMVIGERIQLIIEIDNIFKLLLTSLNDEDLPVKACSIGDDMQQYIKEHLTPMVSFILGDQSADIVALVESLKKLVAEYTTYTNKIEELQNKKGFLIFYYKLLSMLNRRKRNKKEQEIQNHKKELTSKLTGKADSLSELIKVMNEWHSIINNVRQESLYAILLQLVDVVGATCIGINTSDFVKDTVFDVVIIDESGQIQMHNLIVPLSRAKQAIFVGDHKQLAPVTADDIKNEVQSRSMAESFEVSLDLLNKSWFEMLWDNANLDRKYMLDTQFRCPSVISDYISEAFYENKYFAGAPLKLNKSLFSFFKSPLVFIDTSGLPLGKRAEQSRKIETRTEVLGNKTETELVLLVLDKALQENPEIGAKNEIGVIVPYKLHVAEIQHAINTRKKQGNYSEVTTPVVDLVASVDSFQGQERDLIIFTFTRSNKPGRVGFLADWRRLNVAMTRAKAQIVMIGDLSTLTATSLPEAPDHEFKKAMFLLRKYMQEKCQIIPAEEWLNNKVKNGTDY